ncbi:MAG: adenylate/guanylate cyclase domain-containing protein [Roseburia sp.]|nr:adenylate/guanylate cyclase domain-containing protein [Roseburia sp.]
MKIKKEKLIYWGVALLIAVVAFVTSYTQVLYSVDKLIADPLYQAVSTTNKNIKIIAIDEKTLAAYGDIKTWNREIPAKLVEVLNQDDVLRPSVIAFDIMYISEVDEVSDAYFAQVCKEGGNVITAANLVHKAKVDLTEDGTLAVDNTHVEMVEYPYAALKATSGYGFANTVQDKDGYIRSAMLDAYYEGETIDSLSLAAYLKYCEVMGTQPVWPTTFGNNVFTFTFSGKSGAYETVSMCDVIEGKIDARAFAGSIVFVGAYAPGMQDSYNVAVQKGAQMYGVEIHANILEALMEGKTGVVAPVLPYAVLVTVLAVAFYFVSGKLKIVPAAICMVAVVIADVVAAKLLYQNGYVISLIELPVFVILIYAYQLVRGYLTEILKKRKIVSAFKKYVAPQVVDEISKQGEFNIVLGGENRHIAVLFVDIRGFTPMSEGLEPEQVVEILNEYLALTTQSIFKNGGTLDKFIGDATMAVFNAPFDLDDYIYRAVCTARDIAAGSEELKEKLLARYGKTVSFGIGVNCGNAVVGNIGCDFRMDYTAIGDTVNTAARLESNAKRGQILISQDVYEAVKDRVEVTEVGVIPLKGKSNDVFVYQLDKVR